VRLQSKIMTNFFYRAVDALGKQRTGEQEAEDKFSLARLLRAEGLTV
jgi:type II secretory pathway component PulF